MTDEQNKNTLIDEQLVSYLDGELDDQSISDVEQKLSDDQQYRERLVELQKTWDALDTLPRSEPSQSFTASTIELVLSEQKKQVKSRERSYEWVGKFGFTAVILAVGIWLGMITTDHILDSENRQLIENLTLIENIDMYREVESIEFLEQLHDDGVFSAETGNE